MKKIYFVIQFGLTSRARLHRVRVVRMGQLNNYEIKVQFKRATSALERGGGVFVPMSLY